MAALDIVIWVMPQVGLLSSDLISSREDARLVIEIAAPDAMSVSECEIGTFVKTVSVER